MKHCTYCGKEYSDEVDVCPLDGKLVRSVEAQTPEPRPRDVQMHDTTSSAERRFWERMTLRQFAILIVRLQAVWLLFYAVIDATYLPRYFTRMQTSDYYPLYRQISLDSFLAVLRIILHIAAAVALIQYSERVLAWLIKDLIPEPSPNKSLQPTAAAPTDSTHD